MKLWIKGSTLELSTQPGEDPRQIAGDAAATINARQELKDEGIRAEAQGPELKIHVNEFWVFVCPSDKRIIVPPPPYDLRVEKASEGLVHLKLENPRRRLRQDSYPSRNFGYRRRNQWDQHEFL